MTADLLGPDHQAGRGLMRTAVRLLARGAPVTMAEVADEAGVQVTDLIDAPAGRDIEYDNEHRIVGWGLTLIPTPHAFVVDGRRLYTWCAADTLLFPAIIGWPVTAVISVPGAVELDPARVCASCCNPGRFFATAAAAANWLAEHPTGTVLSVADAYPRLRPISDRLLD